MLILCIASANSIWTWYQTKLKFWACRTQYYSRRTSYLVPYHTAPDQFYYHTTPWQTTPCQTVPHQTVPYHIKPNRAEPNRTTPYSIGSTHPILYYTLYSTNGLELRYESSNQGKKETRVRVGYSGLVGTWRPTRLVSIQHDDDDDDGMKYEIRNMKYEIRNIAYSG